MQLFQWVFKATDLLITLSAYFYNILQQHFSMMDKNAGPYKLGEGGWGAAVPHIFAKVDLS